MARDGATSGGLPILGPPTSPFRPGRRIDRRRVAAVSSTLVRIAHVAHVGSDAEAWIASCVRRSTHEGQERASVARSYPQDPQNRVWATRAVPQSGQNITCTGTATTDDPAATGPGIGEGTAATTGMIGGDG